MNDQRRHYRHSLFGSYTVYYRNRDDEARSNLFLRSSLTTLGHFWYQLASRQDLMSNSAIIAAANMLYFDSARQKPKVGASTKKPGSLFRYVRLLNQLDRVWDLQLHDPEDVIRLLPREFDYFVDRQESFA
jgi:hypothetical protein